MGVDETVGLHEALTDWTGVHWQILYVPIVAVAAIGWLGAMRRGTTLELRAGLVLGAAAWVLAQMIEFVAWGPGSSGSESTIGVFAEELGEMTGSALFLLGLMWEGAGQRATAPASASATSSTASLASSGSITAASPASL